MICSELRRLLAASISVKSAYSVFSLIIQMSFKCLVIDIDAIRCGKEVQVFGFFRIQGRFYSILGEHMGRESKIPVGVVGTVYLQILIENSRSPSQALINSGILYGSVALQHHGRIKVQPVVKTLEISYNRQGILPPSQ